ncbi:hypothetical protein GCM10007285_15590 [Stappia taiwanensis]|nr:hypothetical protein GCM10007285_15590 [Stappia taiwanensis]
MAITNMFGGVAASAWVNGMVIGRASAVDSAAANRERWKRIWKNSPLDCPTARLIWRVRRKGGIFQCLVKMIKARRPQPSVFPTQGPQGASQRGEMAIM